MQFQSLAYCGFLAAVAILHRLLPSRLRTPCLLLVSYFFYALWEPGFLILLLAVTAAAYFAARGMSARTQSAASTTRSSLCRSAENSAPVSRTTAARPTMTTGSSTATS